MSARFGKIINKSTFPIYVLCFLSDIVAVFIIWGNRLIPGLLFFGVSTCFLLTTILPMLEWFRIHQGQIETKKLVSRKNIDIPAETILVITRADIFPKFSHKPTFLNGSLAITILKNMTLESACELLHKPYVNPFMPHYTNSSISQTANKKNYVYSMLYKDDTIRELLQFTKATIIIPEYLSTEVPLDEIDATIYIDSFLKVE